MAALRGVLATHPTIYGLGFFERGGQLGVKVYTVDDVGIGAVPLRPGFVSWRILGGELTAEIKRYAPDLAWDELPPAGPTWARLIDQLRARLGVDRVGHFGVTEAPDRALEVKLYVERIGSIPSNLTAR